jgi:uncharacterized membrane protein YeiH
MGIFGKRESYSAQDVRQMMQPIIDLSQNLAALLGGLVVILTRVISIQFDLHLPKFSK